MLVQREGLPGLRPKPGPMQQGDAQPEPTPVLRRRDPWPRRLLEGEPLPAPDPRKRARRDIAGALIGAEAGAGVGLLVLGSVPFAPLGMAALGAAAGFGVMRVHHLLARRWLRHQLRAAR